MSDSNPTAWVNGELIPLSEARLPVTDAAVLYGDSLYEVVPVYNGKMLGASDHIARLLRSLERAHMRELDVDIEEVLLRVIAENKLEHGAVYLQVTGGVQAYRSGLDGVLRPANLICFPLLTPPGQSTEPLSVTLVEDFRWQRCDVKATSLMPSAMTARAIKRAGYDDWIWASDGKVREASASNVILLIDDCIVTPTLSKNILPGVTRKLILEAARREGLDAAERDVGIDECYAASALVLVGSLKEVVPVSSIDEKPVSTDPAWVSKLKGLLATSL